jgi:hypothetical protein
MSIAPVQLDNVVVERARQISARLGDRVAQHRFVVPVDIDCSADLLADAYVAERRGRRTACFVGLPAAGRFFATTTLRTFTTNRLTPSRKATAPSAKSINHEEHEGARRTSSCGRSNDRATQPLSVLPLVRVSALASSGHPPDTETVEPESKDWEQKVAKEAKRRVSGSSMEYDSQEKTEATERLETVDRRLKTEACQTDMLFWELRALLSLQEGSVTRRRGDRGGTWFLVSAGSAPLREI